MANLYSEASVLTLSGLARGFFPEGGYAALKVEKYEGSWREVEVFCTTLFPDTESENGINNGVWVANDDFELRVCHDQRIDQDVPYKITFEVKNPAEQAYVSPPISIQASGTLRFYPTSLDPSGEVLLGVAAGSNPFQVS